MGVDQRPHRLDQFGIVVELVEGEADLRLEVRPLVGRGGRSGRQGEDQRIEDGDDGGRCIAAAVGVAIGGAR